METHSIIMGIRDCSSHCFRNRYRNYMYNGIEYSKNFFCNIKPMVSGPLEPQILLISQSPSLQAWINAGKDSEPDGGLISTHNEFFVTDLLPAFGLKRCDINLFRETVIWVHATNCYPWFNIVKGTRADKRPTRAESRNCIGKWLESLLQIETVKVVVPMGEVAFSLFANPNRANTTYTELMKKSPVSLDVIPNKIFLPIFHQSRKSRIFNDPECVEANKKSNTFLQKLFT